MSAPAARQPSRPVDPPTGRPPILPYQVAPDDLDDPFWEGCVRHEFLVHRCAACGRAYWPASSCLDHGTTSMHWVPAAGTGTVFTYTVFHHAYDPRFVDRVPYVLAVVQLDEGPFFHSDIVECDAGAVQVGMRVEVVYDDVAVDLVIPHFRPSSRVETPDEYPDGKPSGTPDEKEAP